MKLFITFSTPWLPA
jgi:hypothetical protein